MASLLELSFQVPPQVVYSSQQEYSAGIPIDERLETVGYLLL